MEAQETQTPLAYPVTSSSYLDSSIVACRIDVKLFQADAVGPPAHTKSVRSARKSVRKESSPFQITTLQVFCLR
ncbi:hypothetical protein Plhal304r1_c065g0152871 [Plasmopara halstedii]